MTKYERKLARIEKREAFESEKRKIIKKYEKGKLERIAKNFSKGFLKNYTIFNAVLVFCIFAAILFSGKMDLSDTAVVTLGGIATISIGTNLTMAYKYYTKSTTENVNRSDAELKKIELNVNKVVSTATNIVASATAGREG